MPYVKHICNWVIFRSKLLARVERTEVEVDTKNIGFEGYKKFSCQQSLCSHSRRRGDFKRNVNEAHPAYVFLKRL